jgi:NTP pyrophosphatase (non-canonical NTP hydrolase)
MNFTQYKPLALRTEKPLASALLRLEHVALGLATESGEYTTEVKRAAIYDKPLTPEMVAHMREELGDILWYVAIGCDVFNMDIPEYQYLFDTSGLPAVAQLKLASLRIATEIGFFTFEIPNFGLQRHQDSIMRGFVNIVSAVAHACDALGFSIEDVMDENIAKLQERFPNAYSNAAAEARADKGGLDARNS